jgi:CheY-like chemotaxis protein
MKKALRVAVRGFSAFERATFESFFRLSARRSPTYLYSDDLHESEFVIADADNRQVMQEVDEAGKRAQTLSIGAPRAEGVAVSLPRPINLMAVVKALDQLPHDATRATLAPGRPTAPELAAPTTGASLGDSARAEVVAPAPAPLNQPVSHFAMDFDAAAEPDRSVLPAGLPVNRSATAAPLPQTQTRTETQGEPTRFDAQKTRPLHPWDVAPPAADRSEPNRLDPVRPQDDEPAADAVMDHILVVDDSEIALRFMAGLLERYGFQVHLARSGQEAIERAGQRHFTFVFMDVNMPGLDGFQTCKAIKRRVWPDGQEPPTIVMLTSRDTPVDKLRGTMAGCDAYLTKPLAEAALLKVVGDREVRQHAYVDTARATQHG